MSYILHMQNEIPNGMHLIEQKLRQRRKLDDDIEYLMMRQRQMNIVGYEGVAAESQLKYRTYIQQKLASEKLKHLRQEQDVQFIHANRMGILQKQKQQLNRQKLKLLYVQELKKQQILKEELRRSRQSRQRSYQSLNRQKQLYQQIQRQRQINHLISQQRSQQKSMPSHQKQVKFPQNPHKDVNINEKSERSESKSPYRKLKTSTRYHDPIGLANRSQITPIKSEKPSNKKSEQPFMKNPTSLISFSSGKRNKLKIPQFSKTITPPYFMKFNNSDKKKNASRNDKSKSNYRNSKSKRNPQNITAMIPDSQRSHSNIKTCEENALKKIQNRLKLSSILFYDSKLRNIKHELNHLSMTYENEVKCRKDIRDRLNCHPQILKKHKMVVQ